MKLPLYYLFIAWLLISCGSKETSQKKSMDTSSKPRVAAPEIKTQYGWLNSGQEYSLKDFKGKFVLLDFWTFGCINCQHILPDLKKLEEEFKKELVVIGVHSAKFDSEKLSNTIRKAILKFGITHPVVNDANSKIWEQYAIKAWPTLVLIDPNGKIAFQKSGENVYQPFKTQIAQLKKEFEGKISDKTFQFQTEQISMNSLLQFPSKMISDGQGNFWIADSGHHRIVKISASGQILEIIGSGVQGFKDGGFKEAKFYEPQGLAVQGDKLYIADTKNNFIRLANLTSKTVQKIAGDGKLGYYRENTWAQPLSSLNSPWDLWIEGEQMYIASAGNHQILRMELPTQQVYRFAGTGAEALIDGPLQEAAFNQPSGLFKSGNTLYIADAEASAIRALNLQDKTVKTIFGRGLFVFGDKDGELDKALMQHCLGVIENEGILYVADTYNGKIKKIDLAQKRVTTLLAGLDEPNDLLLIDNTLWVTDTNHHKIISVDLESLEKKEIKVF